MTRKRFMEILKEYDYCDSFIAGLWGGRSFDEVDEESLRKIATWGKPLELIHREIQEVATKLEIDALERMAR